MEKLKIFDIIGNLSMGTKEPHLLIDATAESQELPSPDSPEKAYAPFMVNRAFSQHPDTALIANLVNEYPGMPVRMQYDFYRHIISPRKRYGKWAKAAKRQADVELVIKRYNYSYKQACEALKILTPSQLKQIKKDLDTGGKK